MTKILPEDAMAAAEKVIEVTNDLRNKIEAEINAVSMNDAVAFSIAENDKAKAAERYDQATQEFHNRADSFKGVLDDTMLDKLEASQKELGKMAEDSVALFKKIPKPDVNIKVEGREHDE